MIKSINEKNNITRKEVDRGIIYNCFWVESKIIILKNKN